MSDQGQPNELRDIGEELVRLSQSQELTASGGGAADAEALDARGIPAGFCLLWPVARRLLEQLKRKAPPIVRPIIDQLIMEGNRACS